MRRAAVFVLVVILIGCTALTEGIPGNRLGLEILAKIADGTQNQFVSPVSLAYVLSMAAAGAEGDTREGLLKALDAEAPESIAELNTPLAESGMKLAGVAFVQTGISLREDYLAELESQFEALMAQLDDVEQVNAWVSEHTGGLIGKLFDDKLPKELRLLLANAAAMDTEWASPFQPENTWEDVFHTPDGDVQVPFMHQTTYAKYGESGGTQFIRKGYSGNRLAMLIALPPQGKLGSALSSLKSKGLNYFQFNPMPEEVALSLPKMDIFVANTLAEDLKGLGLDRAFREDADFSGISASPLMISDVRQLVRVQVDEEGTRAAVVTTIEMADGTALDEGRQPVSMCVDRPFLILIVDEPTGAICFAGVVAAP